MPRFTEYSQVICMYVAKFLYRFRLKGGYQTNFVNLNHQWC